VTEEETRRLEFIEYVLGRKMTPEERERLVRFIEGKPYVPPAAPAPDRKK